MRRHSLSAPARSGFPSPTRFRGVLSRACRLLVASAGLAGCHIERIVLEEPVRDRIIEVDTEDHIVVRLDENVTAGCQWRAKSSDPFVNVQIEHEDESDDDACATPGLATVHLRVRRGFTGPAAVTLTYRRRWSDDILRRIKLQLFRRQTNVAGWK